MLALLKGGLLFDNAAIFMTNSIYLLLVFFPLHIKEQPAFSKLLKWWFIASNMVCLIMNLGDAVYHSYTRHRISFQTFTEFRNESNLAGIIGTEILRYWYLAIIAAGFFILLLRTYRDTTADTGGQLWKYYIRQSLLLIVTSLVTVCSIRGSFFSTAQRPITISNALQYAGTPTEANIVLNTPFSIIKTAENANLEIPHHFDKAALDNIYTPVHRPSGKAIDKKNIVIIILESFSEEFIGAINGTGKGYTPFLDSLISQSLTYTQSFSNGSVSIDAMPSVISSVPRIKDPVVLTPYSMNKFTSMPMLLEDWGYSTAFFHGADNSSLGLQAYANTAGFRQYYGRTEYNQAPEFNGDKDFDGTWAIWDEEFLQYFCSRTSMMQEPFMAAVFTATSHHPFRIPERYVNRFKGGPLEVHRCIQYTDHALRQYFESARQTKWYRNTIFAITADHTSKKTELDKYKTELGTFRIPIIIFDPSHKIPAERRDGIAQQIDIMPTLLSHIGYDRPYIAFGQDLLDASSNSTWAFNWDNVQQLIAGDYLMQSDGHDIIGLYNYKTDTLLRDNLKDRNGAVPDTEKDEMETFLKAFAQSYVTRMTKDSLVVTD